MVKVEKELREQCSTCTCSSFLHFNHSLCKYVYVNWEQPATSVSPLALFQLMFLTYSIRLGLGYVVFIAFNINHSSILPLMALNSLYCADVPLSNHSLTHSLGLALDWPRVRDISGSPTMGSRPYERDEHLPMLSSGVWSTLPYQIISSYFSAHIFCSLDMKQRPNQAFACRFFLFLGLRVVNYVDITFKCLIK